MPVAGQDELSNLEKGDEIVVTIGSNTYNELAYEDHDEKTLTVCARPEIGSKEIDALGQSVRGSTSRGVRAERSITVPRSLVSSVRRK
jgi:hypothetical protein